MKILSKYIFLVLVLPMVSYAQPDTISSTTLQNFKANLDKLVASAKTEDGNVPMQTAGKPVFVDFDKAFRNTEIAVFTTQQPNSQSFYSFLENTRPQQLLALITAFEEYETYFASAFENQNLPADLKYFAPAVSAMYPRALGNGKRAGVWHLNHFQAIMNGLQVDRLVDERFDVQRSTLVFSRQIQENNALYGSVEMAVLAYFAGNVKMKNILRRLGDDSSYELVLTELPDEVCEKIAAFQAMAVFFKTNTFFPGKIPVKDTVFVNRQVHLKQLAQVLDVPLEDMEALNPQYPFRIVPGDKREARLFLPEGKYDDFMLLQDSIYSVGDSSLFELITQKIEYPPAPTRQYAGERVKDLEIEGKTKIKYVIQTGDVLGFIAEDYDVLVEDLKYWNNIYNERRIQAGATLDIFVDDENAEYYRGLQKQVAVKSTGNTSRQKVFEIPANAQKIEHTVKSGESPYVIAKKYEGVTPEAILYWNGISDARKIQIGQKLTIYLAQ